MPKKIQVEKNLVLSSELAEYILNNPDMLQDVPANSSYVIFTSTDSRLDKANDRLLKSLQDEGKQVVKAIKQKGMDSPWKFIVV